MDLTKLYSTADVMTQTALSRQTLHTYQRMGLIRPAFRTRSGRSYFDESVFNRLKLIALYKRHRPLQDVKIILDVEDALAELRRREPPDRVHVSSAASAGKRGAKLKPSSNRGQPITVTPSPAIDVDEMEPGDLPPDLVPVSPEPVTIERLPERGEALGALHVLPSSLDEKEPAATVDDGDDEPIIDVDAMRSVYPKLYRIGEVIRLSGVKRQTLHNYTVQGLIRAVGRTAAGHRLYAPDVFDRLRQIDMLKRHRNLDEVQKLLNAADKEHRPAVPEEPS